MGFGVFFVLPLSDVVSNRYPCSYVGLQNTEASLMEEQPEDDEHMTKPKTLMEVGCLPYSGRQILLLDI